MAGWRLSDDVVTRDDVLHFVSRMKALNFKLRDQYLYSNTGYTLAGLIVERVSGQPGRFRPRQYFPPLGDGQYALCQDARGDRPKIMPTDIGRVPTSPTS